MPKRKRPIPGLINHVLEYLPENLERKRPSIPTAIPGLSVRIWHCRENGSGASALMGPVSGYRFDQRLLSPFVDRDCFDPSGDVI